MAAPVEMFTRGGPGDADNRGESLVQQHLDRMQQQKEAVAMEKLKKLMPQMGDVVRALALAKADWDLDLAVNMLRSFQVAHLDKINTLNKKRKKIREEMEAYNGSGDVKAAGGSDNNSTDSGSSGSSDSEDSREDRKSKRSKRSSKKHKRDKDKKSKRKRSKMDKKESKRKRRKDDGSDVDDDEEKAKRKLTHTEDFGKYGYVGEHDLQAKWSEFQLWAVEVKGVNVEMLGKAEEKQLWKEYMEDYNTGTLKHRKYYDLVAYERGEAQKLAQSRGGKSEPLFDARADEEALRLKKLEERRQQQQDRLNTAYNILKHTDKAQEMREQELLRAEMNLAYKTGDRARAQKLYERLLPDDQKK